MLTELLGAEVECRAEFYDIDPLHVVWHGHYLKYMEQARCALMDSIGFGYEEMAKCGFAWPIVSLHLKYIRPILFNQRFVVRASLVEYENRVRIVYRIIDKESRAVINKAETVQMAYDLKAVKGLLVTPECFTGPVEAALRRKEKYAEKK